ncbi:MAG: multidrug efflux RND transporter permease subunit [Pirellulaceae bacterium]|nr:multidrug efflux RND transporter permease subunit [Pirellulaceae bacterium]
MSRFFIQRPIFATVISAVILLAGGVSQTRLPVAKFPEISPPTVKVTANYPGANAQVVAETVAAPIEQEVNGVENMLSMSSNSAADGSYSLTVTFNIGADMDMATVLVQNRVSIAEPKLPEEVRRQGVTVKKQSTQIVQMITLTSSDSRFDALYLSNYANLNLRDQLGRIPGVGEVTVFGAGDYSMRIWLDPGKLKARNLTPSDVMAALGEQNVQVAAGQIGAPPSPPGTAFQYTIEALGRLREPEQFEKVIVNRAEGGRLTYLRDVARVELGAKSYAYDASFDGKSCAAVAIYQLPGANAMEVAAHVRSTMERLSRDFPSGLEYQIPFDTTRFVAASVREVYVTLMQAVVLVVLVIFLFLQDWRATLIPCAAIPVSLVGTFAIMSAIGFSVNMLTLFGIVLAIGIVVDDAIVVVENTARHLADGLSSTEAATKAMQEITGPVIATTLVLLAVFVPAAFLGGITGQLFRQFALTISGAVVISTINALTLSPALCGLLLRPSPAGGSRQFFAFRWFNAAFDRTTSGYALAIRGTVRRLTLVLIVYAILLALTGWGFSRLPTGFVPIEDQGYVFANVQLPDAASLERTRDMIRRVDEIARNTPGVSGVISVAGYSLLSGTNSSNMGMVFIVFDPWEDRRDEILSQEGILTSLRRQFGEIREAIVFAFVPPAIDGLGVAGGFQMQIQDRRELGLPTLESAAQEMVAIGSSQAGLRNLNSTFSARVPQLFIEVDRTKATNLNVPLSSIFGTLQSCLGSAYVNDFNRFGRTYQVRVQADSQYRTQAEDIQRLYVRNDDGAMVPLGTLVTVHPTCGAQVITRYNQYPSAQINGEAAPGFSSGDALTLMEQMADSQLPDGMDFEWTGMSYQERLASGGQYGVFVLAILFVFLVLAAQYESWTSPAAIVAVVPLAALGVVLALWMTGMDNNSYTQIGIVLLVSLASKNAILIVEFARELRREGKSICDAAVEAARTRFRAILMTAFSSILGFLPLVIASGAGAASRRAVGYAIVGGMTAATLFSLLLVPAFFVLFQWLGERFHNKGGDSGPCQTAAPTSSSNSASA